ncbi:TIGR04149 family rSAM-modified RiPP [Parabacteroides distasonis]|uniref:RSAM-modified peptide n=1 Tax=Parabacteroides distasonis TaxID=823 RepID=A0A3L7ZSU7_PARDI|nr:TIGR04149 family rSAM-modified RiPP [Parabacteroides distasonis]NBH88249.1 rSAM-modified peptide [Parabacteroides distasonis]RLT74896.1 rSAM-modified peptide [Parabacteroides distasonis]TGY61214.1 rSAM-modified peptide [Parabacteroides distasonis]
MKQVKKLKLSELSKKELNERQLKELKGGDYCRDKCGTSSPTIGSAYGEWTAYF